MVITRDLGGGGKLHNAYNTQKLYSVTQNSISYLYSLQNVYITHQKTYTIYTCVFMIALLLESLSRGKKSGKQTNIVQQQ